MGSVCLCLSVCLILTISVFKITRGVGVRTKIETRILPLTRAIRSSFLIKKIIVSIV